MSDFKVTNDGKKIVYLNNDGGLYIQSAGKDKEKIDSEVIAISYIDDNFKTIYYTKENALYKKVEGKDKEQIASDIDLVLKIYQSGEALYIKSDNTEHKLIDFVEDDMKDIDSAIKEPVAPKSPSYWDYISDEEYLEAREQYETGYDEYLKAKETYNKKQARDKLRTSLSEKSITIFSNILCYYNGEKEKELTDTLGSGISYYIAENHPAVIFSAYSPSEIKKAKLSELKTVLEVEDMVNKALYSASEKYIAVKDSVTVIEQKNVNKIFIDSEGKTVYFFDKNDKKSDDIGDVYRVSISDNKPQKPELYDSDVYIYSLNLLENGKAVYFKDVKNNKGELYIDKERIDYDVYLYHYTYHADSDTFVYMVDWNDDKDYGTLKNFKNSKSVKIADDVHTYAITPNGEILYLCDYSSKYNHGELYIYKNNKAVKIDDEVTYIVPIVDVKYRSE